MRASELVLEVWDDDTLSRDEPIGGVRFKMMNLNLNYFSEIFTVDIFFFENKQKPKEIAIETKIIEKTVSESENEEIWAPSPSRIYALPVQNCRIENCNDKFVNYMAATKIIKENYLQKGQVPRSIEHYEEIKNSINMKMDIHTINFGHRSQRRIGRMPGTTK